MFKLSEKFLEKFRGSQPNWGYGALSYFTFKRTYSRIMDNGAQEEFYDTLKRVTEGTFRIQERHCKTNGLPWNAHQAQKTAQEFFQKMWDFKFLPPGRGLWMMGTEIVNKIGSAGLNNCGFVSTKDLKIEFASPFAWAMDMLMLGVGIGFDAKGAGTIIIKRPKDSKVVYDIPDTREGWVESVRLLLNSYQGGNTVEFMYEKIRPFGADIKGFGGKSSGPQPLIDLHDSIRDILDNLIGEQITSVVIVDIMNFIGKCVVSGNVRRSAELGIGDIDDIDYIQMKSPTLFSKELYDRRWASNNSVFAKKDSNFGGVIDNIIANGEPGLIFLDNARHYGRMKDGWVPFESERYDDVHGFNPCVTKDTWVQTDQGPKQVSNLIDKEFTAIVDGKKYKATGFWKTGIKKTYRLITEEGYELRLTDNHKILKECGEWIEAGKLQPGDKIVINNHRSSDCIWGDQNEDGEGYLMGLLVGDGTFSSDGVPVLSAWRKNNPGVGGILEAVDKAASGLQSRSDFAGWSYIKDREEHRYSMAALRDISEKYEIKRNKFIGSAIESSSSSFYRGFLRGLFDSDGSVQGTQEKGVSIRLNQSDLKRLKATQRMLLRLGVTSKIYKRREEGTRSMPDGNGGNKEYFCKTNYDLIISGEDILQYKNIIGFSDFHKKELLDKAIMSYKRAPNKTRFSATFLEMAPDMVEDVYDVTVDEVHAFDANGLYVHNCVEQALENYELCCLVETFPGNHESAEEYRDTLKYAYLYAKSVTLIPTHEERTNAVMMRNRRIGCSMSGIQQAFKKFGHSAFLSDFCDEGYQVIKKWDRIYSRWLGVPRSVKMTTVKPSGTVSILAGATPGIHFTHSEYYWRTVRCSAISPLVRILKEAGYKIEYSFTDKERLIEALEENEYEASDVDKFLDGTKSCDFVFNSFAANGGTCVVYFPVKEKNFTKSKFEVSVWEQVLAVREMQHYWSDNGVSCTVTFNKDESRDLQKVIEFSAPYVKSLSFLPLTDHSYKQAPYQECSKEDWLKYSESLKDLDFSSSDETKISGSKFCDGDSCEI